MLTTQTEQNWQQQQRDYFSGEWKNKWQIMFCFLDSEKLEQTKTRILQLDYENFYQVNNAFGKIEKALQICDFLRTLQSQTPPQDTDKIIVTTFVSCAEAVRRINRPKETNCENLVKGFFSYVDAQIKYKIMGQSNTTCETGKCEVECLFNATEVLYGVRNDYIHNGNFTGRFFKESNAENPNFGCFFYSEKENKSCFIEATSDCDLRYEEFRNIFLEAFVANIEEFLK